MSGPTFVGGTGRSGTSILGKLLSKHSTIAFVPIELVVPSADGGIADIVTGNGRLDRFLTKMRTVWWRSPRPESSGLHDRGLYRIADEETRDRALAAFESEMAIDPLLAGRRLVEAFTNPIAAREGKPRWVDTTPYNPFKGSALCQMFPDAKIIHVVRDGRDVACSVAGTYFGPSAPEEGLTWWADRLRRAHHGSHDLSTDRLMTVQFEDLIMHDRDVTFGRLLGFLGLDPEFAIRDYFDTEMSAESAHLGRWRDLSDRQANRLDAAYREILAELHADGVSCAPAIPET